MRFLIAALVAVFFYPSAGASAERSICGSHAMVAGHLARQWGETVSWRGLAGGNLVELYTVAPEVAQGTAPGGVPGAAPGAVPRGVEGGWTLVMTRPDGVACFVASGRDGETVRPATGADRPS